MPLATPFRPPPRALAPHPQRLAWLRAGRDARSLSAGESFELKDMEEGHAGIVFWKARAQAASPPAPLRTDR